MKSYDKGLDSDDKLQLPKLIPLGYKFFRWINTGIIIPIFTFLGKYFTNYGVIILLMTLIIKAVLMPLTFKSYMSSARMRVLKPQMEEINAKYDSGILMLTLPKKDQQTLPTQNRIAIE